MAHFGTILLALVLLIAMGGCLWFGRRLGERQRVLSAGEAPPQTTTIETAILGLLGLLLAFSVSGAAGRFDARRRLIVDESNAIGTANLRLELLPEEPRKALRQKLFAYVGSRLAIYQQLPDRRAAQAEIERSQRLQREIWAAAVAACQPSTTPAGMPAGLLLLPALNQMIDLASTRNLLSALHPPTAIFGMLLLVMLTSALYTGYGAARSSKIHLLGFIILTVLVFVLVLDLEYPRLGLLREESFDRALIDLRSSLR